MPGFVDVSNMSDLEIKRLGQQDDDDNDPAVIAHNRRYSRGRYTRPSQPAVSYSVDTVWAAAAYAHRVNGGYFKVDQFDVVNSGAMPTKRSNKMVMTAVLNDQTKITDDDRATGTAALEFISKQLTVKMLKGKFSDFDRSMINVVEMKEFLSTNRLEIALVASQIRAYEQAQKDLALADRVDHSKGYLADVGVKVNANVEVTKVVYSHNYNIYFVSGITDTNQAVFFSYREKFDIGTHITIKGTVKAHRPDSTQLSRVRVL